MLSRYRLCNNFMSALLAGMNEAGPSADNAAGTPRPSHLLLCVQKNMKPSELILNYMGEIAKRVNKVSDTSTRMCSCVCIQVHVGV